MITSTYDTHSLQTSPLHFSASGILFRPLPPPPPLSPIQRDWDRDQLWLHIDDNRTSFDGPCKSKLDSIGGTTSKVFGWHWQGKGRAPEVHHQSTHAAVTPCAEAHFR
jgi:hypothetical protein